MTVRSPWIVAIAAVAALGATALAPATARAQAGERAATAEDLFRQALQLTRQGKFAEACPKFAESHRIDPAYGALMNLGACYERTGRTASAWQAYVDAAELARDKGQRARAETARKKASQLAPRLIRLELRLGPGVELTRLEITRNGKPFDPALLGNAVPVDPGSYAIAASHAGAAPWTTSVTATEPGTVAVVEIGGPVGRPIDAPSAIPGAPEPPPLPAPATAAALHPPAAGATAPRASAAAVPTPATAADSAGGRRLRIAGVALAAGGAALAVTGAAFAWMARSISNDYTHATAGERFDPARDHRARTYQTSAFVLWGVGAAAIAGGATCYVLGRRAGAEVRMAAIPLSGGGAAAVSGRW